MKRYFLSDNRIKVLVLVILLFAITFSIFLYTVKIRRPWFGNLSPGHHQWLTGSTLKFAKNWYREGPFGLKFGMFENPKSIEFPTLESRKPYASYPPGTVIPIYLISKIVGSEPRPTFIMWYNLLNHFLIAFFLGLIIFFLVLDVKLGYSYAFLLSLIPITIELLMPSPLYWHQNVFFSDQAVILPIVLFTFLEVIRNRVKNRKAAVSITLLQSLIAFYGILTDWLFLFIALAIYIKRICNGEMGRNFRNWLKNSFLYWISTILALLLFLLQLSMLKYDIVGTFMFRSGLSEESKIYTSNFFQTFWRGHIAQGYGTIAIIILWFCLFLSIILLTSALYNRFRKKPAEERLKKVISLIVIMTIPFFVQIYTFKNHSAVHSFSTLKLSLTLALVPFALSPLLIFILLEKYFERIPLELDGINLLINEKKETTKIMVDFRLLLVMILILFTSIYVKIELPNFRALFPEPGNYSAEVFLAQNTRHQDIVFSTDYEIPCNPPQQLSYSMKRVYKIDSLSDIFDMVSDVNSDYTIDIFFSDANETINNQGIQELTKLANIVVYENNYHLYKIEKPAFLELYEATHQTDAAVELRPTT
jgi:hypothetical protein